MCGHGSLQMMCELWIISNTLDGALQAFLATLQQDAGSARFPPFHMAASVWKVLYPTWFMQGIFKPTPKAPLVGFIASVESIVIQIIRAISKYFVCICSRIVRSGINGEAHTLLMGLWGLTLTNMWCICLAVVCSRVNLHGEVWLDSLYHSIHNLSG